MPIAPPVNTAGSNAQARPERSAGGFPTRALFYQPRLGAAYD